MSGMCKLCTYDLVVSNKTLTFAPVNSKSDTEESDPSLDHIRNNKGSFKSSYDGSLCFHSFTLRRETILLKVNNS